MMGAALVATFESTGAYYGASRLAGATLPLAHALIRSIGLQLADASMSKINKDLLDEVDRPSILDGLLLNCKDPTPQNLDKRQNYVNPKERPSFAPLPKSQALEKARDFLQVMAKANKELEMKAHKNPGSNYDIEVLNGDEDEYIEMDLLLGVADLHDEDAVVAAEASISCFHPTIADIEGDDDDDDSDDDFDDNKCIEDEKRCARTNADYDKSSSKAKPNKRPRIVMLD